MKRLLSLLLLMFALCLSRALADIPTIPNSPPQSDTLSSTGTTTTLTCQGGQSVLSFQTSGTYSGVTLTPQGSLTGAAGTFVNLPSAASVSSNTIGSYAISGIPYVNFNLSAIASGSITVKTQCSAAAPGTVGISGTLSATVVGTANANITQVGSTSLTNTWLPTGGLQDSNGVNRQSVFADNPANSSCNSSVAGAACTGTLTSSGAAKVVQGTSSDYIYIPRIHFYNTSATTITVTMTEGSGTGCATGTITLGTWIVPAGLGNNPPVSAESPLVTHTSGDSICLNPSGSVTSFGYSFPIAITTYAP